MGASSLWVLSSSRPRVQLYDVVPSLSIINLKSVPVDDLAAARQEAGRTAFAFVQRGGSPASAPAIFVELPKRLCKCPFTCPLWRPTFDQRLLQRTPAPCFTRERRQYSRAHTRTPSTRDSCTWVPCAGRSIRCMLRAALKIDAGQPFELVEWRCFCRASLENFGQLCRPLVGAMSGRCGVLKDDAGLS